MEAKFEAAVERPRRGGRRASGERPDRAGWVRPARLSAGSARGRAAGRAVPPAYTGMAAATCGEGSR